MRIFGTIFGVLIALGLGLVVLYPIVVPMIIASSVSSMYSRNAHFSYNLEATASFDLAGERYAQTIVVRCNAYERGGAPAYASEQPDSATFEFALPDGSAITLSYVTLCQWSKAPPSTSVAVDYVVRPKEKTVRFKDGKPTANGRAAWLKSATRHDQIRIYDLADLVAGQGPGVERFTLTAITTKAEPTIASDLAAPVLAHWRGQEMMATPPKFGSPEWKLWQAEGRLWVLSADLAEVAPKSSDTCPATLAPLATGTDWVVVPFGACFGGRPTPVALDLSSDLQKLTLFAREEKAAFRIGYTRAALVDAGVEHWVGLPLRNAGTAEFFHWDQDVCIETRCFALTANEGRDRNFVFYHPPSQRLLTLSIESLNMNELTHW